MLQERGPIERPRRDAMFDGFIAIAAATGAILQLAIASIFFGTLGTIVLASFSIVPMPY